jgi:5'-3' exonuclease
MDLIIDGNAFINVAISVTKTQALRDKRTGETYYVNDLFNDGGFILKEHVKLTFRNFCFTYLNSLIAPIGPTLDRVHFVFDSKSWRKEYTSSFFERSDFKTTSAPTEFKYKGNRKYDDHQYLFFDYFQQVIIPALNEKCGVNYYRFKSTEGDDIIAYLCETLDRDLLIYSVDQDLKQLVGIQDKNVMLIVPKQMSKTKKIFVPTTLIPEKAEDEVDDFFSLSDHHISGSSTDKIIKSFKSKDFVEHTVDLVEEVLSKILLGDKSDNIPKITGITPSKAAKILEKLRSTHGDQIIHLLDEMNPAFILSFIEEISIVNKLKDKDKIDELREHLIFNIKIIRLSTKVFPEEIREALQQFFTDYSSSKFNHREFTSLKNNLSSL